MSRTVALCGAAVALALGYASMALAQAPKPAAAASASGDTYEVALVPPAAAKPGAPATAKVVVKAKGPYHVNKDYPMAFRPDATASTVAFAGEKVPLNQAGAERTACKDHPGESCAVASPLPFTAKAAGEATLAGVVAFSVCNPDRCLIEKVPVTASVAAK
ncbi:MAG: hypothetical protein QM704_15975 [Anaeromyxobacteraceae bacterium]